MTHNGNAGSRWYLAISAVIVTVAIAALVTAQRGGRLPFAAGRPQPTLSAVRDPSPITLGEYIAQHRQVTERPFVSSRIAGQSGQMVTYTITNLTPDTGDRCEVRWTQLDRDRNRPAEESFWRYERVLGWPDGLVLRARTAPATWTGDLWVPLPNPFVDVGWFLVRLHLLCDGREIGKVDTEAFRVEPVPMNAPASGTPLP
jgi:hypothetical protein